MIIQFKYGLAFLLIAIGLAISSCGLFETREPEDPGSVQTKNEPATSAEIVVKNLRTALTEKNIDNYLNCLSEKTNFKFEPSASAKAQFPSIFVDWNLNAERKYFNSMISMIPTGLEPLLLLTETNYDSSSPDSTIFTAKYILEVPHSNSNLTNKFTGKIYLTILPDNSKGTWYISRWTDLPLVQSDTLTYTWSYLKAGFFN